MTYQESVTQVEEMVEPGFKPLTPHHSRGFRSTRAGNQIWRQLAVNRKRGKAQRQHGSLSASLKDGAPEAVDGSGKEPGQVPWSVGGKSTLEG